MNRPGPVTRIATSDATSVTIGGLDLTEEILGRRSFTEMTYFLSVGRMPDEAESAVLDACLVSLMEHGWTPTSIITRLTASSVPDDVQVAVAAGLLSVGPVFAGTMEGCAELLLEVDEEQDLTAWARTTASLFLESRRPVPGFGHRLHKPVDPRAVRLLEIAREQGLAGRFVERLEALEQAIADLRGKPLPVNATGVIAALFLEIGLPLRAARGMAVVSRAAGLVGHVVEEDRDPATRTIWQLTREGIPYEPPEQEVDDGSPGAH